MLNVSQVQRKNLSQTRSIEICDWLHGKRWWILDCWRAPKSTFLINFFRKNSIYSTTENSTIRGFRKFNWRLANLPKLGKLYNLSYQHNIYLWSQSCIFKLLLLERSEILLFVTTVYEILVYDTTKRIIWWILANLPNFKLNVLKIKLSLQSQ